MISKSPLRCRIVYHYPLQFPLTAVQVQLKFTIFLCVRLHFFAKKYLISIAIVYGGSRGGHPLFLDQIEARGAEEIFFDTGHPPYLSQPLDDSPPLSEALDPPLIVPSPSETLPQSDAILISVTRKRGHVISPDTALHEKTS